MAQLPKGSFCLEGYIDVPPARLLAVTDALHKHVSLTRNEEGCIYFNVDKCPDNAGRFLVSEAFADEAAFQFHQARASASEWAKVTDGIARNYKTWVV